MDDLEGLFDVFYEMAKSKLKNIAIVDGIFFCLNYVGNIGYTFGNLVNLINEYVNKLVFIEAIHRYEIVIIVSLVYSNETYFIEILPSYFSFISVFKNKYEILFNE